jgi:hypothetical protein
VLQAVEVLAVLALTLLVLLVLQAVLELKLTMVLISQVGYRQLVLALAVMSQEAVAEVVAIQAVELAVLAVAVTVTIILV